MIIGLQITKNKDKYKKLVSLLNKNEFKGISFVHISDYKSLKRNFKDLNVLVCYGITPELFSYRSDKLKWIHIGAVGIAFVIPLPIVLNPNSLVTLTLNQFSIKGLNSLNK